MNLVQGRSNKQNHFKRLEPHPLDGFRSTLGAKDELILHPQSKVIRPITRRKALLAQILTPFISIRHPPIFSPISSPVSSHFKAGPQPPTRPAPPGPRRLDIVPTIYKLGSEGSRLTPATSLIKQSPISPIPRILAPKNRHPITPGPERTAKIFGRPQSTEAARAGWRTSGTQRRIPTLGAMFIDPRRGIDRPSPGCVEIEARVRRGARKPIAAPQSLLVVGKNNSPHLDPTG